MVRIVLVRPGATDFHTQGRITGTLDLPLSLQGREQAQHAAGQLGEHSLDMIYSAPCQAARQTAEIIAAASGAKVKCLDKLQNLNHGLWQGKLIEEVRQCQPRVYRQWQEHPETVCPPQGETLQCAQERIEAALARLMKKHPHRTVALVVPEPLASLVRSQLNDSELGDLWKAECECGHWELIEVGPPAPVHSA